MNFLCSYRKEKMPVLAPMLTFCDKQQNDF